MPYLNSNVNVLYSMDRIGLCGSRKTTLYKPMDQFWCAMIKEAEQTVDDANRSASMEENAT